MSSRSLNKVMLIGNLTRDPELRYTPQGTAVCSFGLATNRSWMPSDSTERREETEFHRIVSWNKLAELCSQLLTKGRKVYVEGRLQTRSWETSEGDRRQTTEIVAEDMVILDQKRPVTAEMQNGEETQKVEGSAEKTAATEDTEKEAENKKSATAEARKNKETQKETVAASAKKAGASTKGKKETGKEEKNPPAGGDEEIDIDDIPF